MKPNYGDEIERTTGIGFSTVHTGIYIGNNQVIHFDGESSSDGKEISIRDTPIKDKHAKKIVKRAIEIMNDKNNRYNGNYGVFFGRNCQDFTQDCYEVVL